MSAKPRKASMRKGLDLAHLAKSDALRLLRCINDTQARGREGAKVDPPRAAQEIAGLEVGSERYHAALGYLAEEGALSGDEHTEVHTGEAGGHSHHAYAAYLFTGRALRLLEEHDDWLTTYDPDDPNAYPEAY